MSSISLSSVSFSYTSARDVIVDADLDLGPGWHGLVGANGSGKTTLLALLAGELQPTSGSLVGPQPVKRCPQVVDALTPDIRRFAGSHEAEAYVLRGRLEIDPEQVERWETLSPGERRRWQVGAALADAPAVLLLDEPTNHLDRGSTDLLLSMLHSHRGIGVVVSHDRRVLDELTASTIRIRRGRVAHWGAPYSAARTEWEAAAAQIVAARQTATAETRKLERRLDDQRRAAEAKRSAWQRSQRYARPGDHDATSTARTERFRSGAAAAGRRIGALREEVQRADERRRALAVEREHRGSISFEGDPAPRPLLVSHHGPLEVGDVRLLDQVSAQVERGSRIRLAGPNGAGKSTLMQSLVDAWTLPPDRLLHLPQDLTEAESARMLDVVRSRSRDELGKTMQLFARLGGEPGDVMASELPSPGEVRKLLLADGLQRNVWCLMLDEPTNHLDLDTVERLEEALGAFPGALVVISHDDRFAEAVTDATISL